MHLPSLATNVSIVAYPATFVSAPNSAKARTRRRGAGCASSSRVLPAGRRTYQDARTGRDGAVAWDQMCTEGIADQVRSGGNRHYQLASHRYWFTRASQPPGAVKLFPAGCAASPRILQVGYSSSRSELSAGDQAWAGSTASAGWVASTHGGMDQRG